MNNTERPKDLNEKDLVFIKGYHTLNQESKILIHGFIAGLIVKEGRQKTQGTA